MLVGELLPAVIVAGGSSTGGGGLSVCDLSDTVDETSPPRVKWGRRDGGDEDEEDEAVDDNSVTKIGSFIQEGMIQPSCSFVVRSTQQSATVCVLLTLRGDDKLQRLLLLLLLLLMLL